MRTSKYKQERERHTTELGYFEQWLKTRNYSNDTIRTYGNYTAGYLEWLSDEQYQVADISYNELLSYIENRTNKGDSKTNLNRKIAVIRMYYDYLLYTHKARKNPATGLYIMNKRQTVPNNLLSIEELSTIYENYQVTDHRSQRNKVIIGLLVYQAVTREELEKLELTHIKLTTGKLEIPGGRHSNSRTIQLEAVQMLELQEYITKTRPEIHQSHGKYGTGRKPRTNNTAKAQNQLLLSMHATDNIKNSFLHLLHELRRNNPKLQDARQIRQSVITNWLKTKNLRQVQYMAGHRYVSSTERYQINKLDELQESLRKHHPLQ